MRRFGMTQASGMLRYLMLRPEATVDPESYPEGFVPIHGNEPVDVVYGMLKRGLFVAPANKIEVIHQLHGAVESLCRSEYPVVKVDDIVSANAKIREIQSRILIRRDFWVLDDFNDPEQNKSFGVQNFYFDNYKWSQVLWKRFQFFVEEYFPLSEHSHLFYTEYVNLIKSFSAFEQGTRAQPVLPKSVSLHPPYGVTTPSGFTLEPLELYKRWLTNFRKLFQINSALVLNAGTAVVPFVTKLCGVHMVRAVDSRPRCVQAGRKDALRNKLFSSVSFQVAEFLPEFKAGEKKYDASVFYPDESSLGDLNSPETSIFAPGEFGYAGKLERFFDEVSEHISETGIVVVCCTNMHSLLYPHLPNPIELEIKTNRRYVLLDYYDSPVHSKGSVKTNLHEPKVENYSILRNKLRAELWVLHKIEAIEHFGFVHGIPGAKPPNVGRRQMGTQSLKSRQRILKNHVELMGGDWGTYKSRLASMLRESADTEEDSVAQAVRMALDPTYPQELSEKAKVAVENSLSEAKLFHAEVQKQFPVQSPREYFDKNVNRL
ncbi:polypeptide chain release factor methylase [Angomonas deanei]|nr:polypeptide chain release factor methylase [Angomonas deanei]|eukprot:EPY39933.1 polypeptide chain release factor methylase [Angomonas deanei]